MRTLLIILLVLVGSTAQAQAPSPLPALLKDAQAEFEEAAKALKASDVYRRYERAERLLLGLRALAAAAEKTTESK